MDDSRLAEEIKTLNDLPPLEQLSDDALATISFFIQEELTRRATQRTSKIDNETFQAILSCPNDPISCICADLGNVCLACFERQFWMDVCGW